jgi:hypothetical protein
MDLEAEKETSEEEKQGSTTQAGRPPPYILTSTTNLLQLQKNISAIVQGSFEFRTTRNGVFRRLLRDRKMQVSQFRLQM